MFVERQSKPLRHRYQRHLEILVWKSYLQRRRRWRPWLAEILFASILFVLAILIAKPVFLTLLQKESTPPLTTADILSSIDHRTYLGYAPANYQTDLIMATVSEKLKINITGARSEVELFNTLYSNSSKGSLINFPVIMVIFQRQDVNKWRFDIRSSDRSVQTSDSETKGLKQHLKSGFLAVQMAVSQGIIEQTSPEKPEYEISLVSMPVSPLMEETKVKNVLAWILICFTLAFIAPVVETETLVINETNSGLKRALKMHDVDFVSMYVGWLVYFYLTVLPICVIAGIFLIFIFRWIQLPAALFFVLTYASVMIMVAFIMSMFHNKVFVASVWSTLYTVLQTFTAEMLVHHNYDSSIRGLSFLLHVFIPPLGLVNGFHQFAMLQTGRGANTSVNPDSILTIILSWTFISVIYFAVLMFLQRTLSNKTAIGGQVSWRSVVFRKVEDRDELHPIQTPTGKEREQLQEVDELVAKSVTFENVSKAIMDNEVVKNITLDIYRGEYSMLYTERVQEIMLDTIEDLLAGLTKPDTGAITVLGHAMNYNCNFMTVPHMMGYCHKQETLITDLTVEEHIIMFIKLSLWMESSQYILEYTHIRIMRLYEECDLHPVQHTQVNDLSMYYRAQLCWALALLLEPRIILMSSQAEDNSEFSSVIVDKIVGYRKYCTIIQACFWSMNLVHADRVFIFDHKQLIFGGTPAYLFFQYGRDYRLRLTLEDDRMIHDEKLAELFSKIEESGCKVRAYFGSLMVLRVPVHPTSNVADFIKYLTENSDKFGCKSMNLSIADSEEVTRRAIFESRKSGHRRTVAATTAKAAVIKLDSKLFRRAAHFTVCVYFYYMAWKFYSFHRHFKLSLFVTVVACVIAGLFVGSSLASKLSEIEVSVGGSKKVASGDILTVEALGQKTTFALRSDDDEDSISVINSYVFSEKGASPEQVKNIYYTALSDDEIQALYSPLHVDELASVRSLARVFMALQRHYSKQLDSSIIIVDKPISLDITPWMQESHLPPLLVQFLMLTTVAHITFLPSMEYKLIRHIQVHAYNSSPTGYWLSLYFWDLLLYLILAIITLGSAIGMMCLIVPWAYAAFFDLYALLILLVAYGVGCIPQAYLFSLGSNVALNSMMFIIVNVVFGESTMMAKLFYGESLNYILYLMNFSPQFSLVQGFVKIRKLFLYNSECKVFERMRICPLKPFHKCCQKCGFLQECFKPKPYILSLTGILPELIALVLTGLLFTVLLLAWEFKSIQYFLNYIMLNWLYPEEEGTTTEKQSGTAAEMTNVKKKLDSINKKERPATIPFGELILVNEVTDKKFGVNRIFDVSFGVGKGEALAVTGQHRHGRDELCEVVSGFRMPSSGDAFVMSKWSLVQSHHEYSRRISLSSSLSPLPPWMTVINALQMIAIFRGVPHKHVKSEVWLYLEALELCETARVKVSTLKQDERTRLHFAAAVIGAPPVVIVNECTAYQKFSVRRSMYSILHMLKRRGHAIIIASARVESQMPLSNRILLLLNRQMYDINQVDQLIEQYSSPGFTVVLHVKDEIDPVALFRNYFAKITINDVSEVLINVQILDRYIKLSQVFQRMEMLQSENPIVYSYIVTSIPIEYIYNKVLSMDYWNTSVLTQTPSAIQKMDPWKKTRVRPSSRAVRTLAKFEQKYDITKLKELPWSVIFHN